MTRIGTRLIDGKLSFVASCLGPGPTGTLHADDEWPLLLDAVEATPGATIAESRRLGIAIHWGDEVDYQFECLLEITAANVAALLKCPFFHWEDDALAAARGVVSLPEALDRIRALQAHAKDR
jgi:hypothetical protein